MSAKAREKRSEMSRFGGKESVRIFVIAIVRNRRSLFQSFLYVFRRGAGSCPR